MRKILLSLLFCFCFSSYGFSQEEDQGSRDKVYEYFGRDGKIYDTSIEYRVHTIPSHYGRLIAVEQSVYNTRERELWFEANDGTIRRVILVPIKDRKPPYLIYREVITFERD